MKYDIALLLAALAVGILIGSGVHAFTHRHYQEIIKTTIYPTDGIIVHRL